MPSGEPVARARTRPELTPLTGEASDLRHSVMQVCDSLCVGGLERVAVNIANELPADRYRSYLCTTRSGGPLSRLVGPHVTRMDVGRRSRYDVGAIRRFGAYLRERDIRILHAHGTALFFSVAAAALAPRAIVLWHDHFGRFHTENRPVWLYRIAAHRTRGVIGVSRRLADWAVRRLQMAPESVWYLPNFVREVSERPDRIELPGTDGFRVICLANLRPEKDHENLIRAMAFLVRRIPAAHLLLVGDGSDPEYVARLHALATTLGLGGHVSWLGKRDDVGAILASCDVGVLGSASEGLPLAVLEYGVAGLATVATDVGECGEVLAGGEAGLVVPPGEPNALGEALLRLLALPEERARLGRALQDRCRRLYSSEAGMSRVLEVYHTVLGGRTASVSA